MKVLSKTMLALLAVGTTLALASCDKSAEKVASSATQAPATSTAPANKQAVPATDQTPATTAKEEATPATPASADKTTMPAQPVAPVANETMVETVTLTPVELQAQQLVDATAWFQQSAEYRALAYQSFNFAKIAFDQAQVAANQTKAVVVDLDETMIDNSIYEGALIKYGASFSNKTWSAWEQHGTPTALPGAVAFASYVNSHGGKMYYISNRSDDNKAPTMKTLEALGFPGVSADTVLLKTDTSNKDVRYNQVLQHDPIVLYIGDNLNDFMGVYGKNTVAARKEWVDANKNMFGVKYIMMPNPMYGNWMSSLAENFYSLSGSEQNKVRQQSVHYWSDFPTFLQMQGN